MTYTDPATLTDWRGTPIRGGDTVIYGAGVGRSIALVEATVEPDGRPHPDGSPGPRLTPSGRVWLQLARRAYGYVGDSSETRVHVGADRLTVVTALPPSALPRIDAEILTAAQSSIRWHEKAIAAVERDGPTSARDPRYTWTAEEEIAYHRSKLTAAQARLTEFGTPARCCDADPVPDVVSARLAEGGASIVRQADALLRDLLGQAVTITHPTLPSTWTGRLIAISDHPSVVIEKPDGQRLSLPQTYEILPVPGRPLTPVTTKE